MVSEMSTSTATITPPTEPKSPSLKGFLKDPEFQAELQRRRLPDNRTNLYYLAITWVEVALVLGGAIAFFLWREQAGLFWLWDVPVALLAIFLLGALQHK